MTLIDKTAPATAPGARSTDRTDPVARAVADAARLGLILDAVGDLTFEVDLRLYTILLPERAWNLLNRDLPPGPVAMTAVFKWLHSEDVEEFRLALNRCIARNTSFNHQVRIRTGNGEFLVWRWRGRPVFGEDGSPKQFLGTISDVTEIITARKRLAHKSVEAERLQQALDKQLKINAVQRAFVSMVSHEFRTPLTVIKGIANQVKRRREKIPPERLGAKMDLIDTSVAELVDHMEAILMSAQIEAGQLDCEPAPTDLNDLAQNVMRSVGHTYPDQTFVFSPAEPALEVHCDPDLIQKVIINLLRNAARFSQEGTRIELAIFPAKDENVEILVCDYGPGIPPDELPFVFDRFFRGSTAGTISGTGVGLSLVKSFAELHDGSVHAISELGRGTRVTVLLPQRGPMTAPARSIGDLD
ncbi:MAG: HAMP domain-containing sensor histidine kinase [Pseudomonadota bacterium]